MVHYNFFLFLLQSLIILYLKIGIVKGIVGGLDATRGQFPFMVSVQADNQHVCGGAIIGEQHVLTAGHCVIDEENNFRNKRFSIRAGIINLDDANTPGIVENVAKIFVPNEYTRVRSETSTTYYDEKGDIAILKLANAIDLSANSVSKLNFPIRSKSNWIGTFSNEILTFIGFGTDVPSRGVKRDRNNEVIQRRVSRTLKHAEVGVLHKIACKNELPFEVQKHHMCGQMIQKHETMPEGSCNGDTGGPLVDGDAIVGILSQNRPDCDEQHYVSIYTRVSSYASLITKLLRRKIVRNCRIVEYQERRAENGEVTYWVEIN